MEEFTEHHILPSMINPRVWLILVWQVLLEQLVAFALESGQRSNQNPATCSNCRRPPAHECRADGLRLNWHQNKRQHWSAAHFSSAAKAVGRERGPIN